MLQTTRIHEAGNHVLHGLPISIQLLEDSLAGIHFDATRYTIYNYYTGRIVSSLALDSNLLPGLLRQARVAAPRDYQLMSVQEGREAGIPVLSVEGVFYNREKQQYYIIINAAFATDTFIEVRGVTEPATAAHHVYYVAGLNRHFTASSAYTVLKCGNMAPAFLFGGLVQENRLLVPDVELAHIDSPGHGMLCSIALQEEPGRVSSVPVPFDRRSRAQRKRHLFDQMSFAGGNGRAYYVSDGKRIIYCKDNTFRNRYSVDSSEHVYNLYYNRSRHLLYINTRFGESASGSKIFTLDTAAGSLNLIDASGPERSVDFINDSLILSIHKTPDDEHYAFSLYRY
ncbi:MAG: hypothetical protein JNL13_13925 [Chitinophagaceae bacterium]|nr:hypothetical protein [Chitinophagaceae bacterium]